MPPLFWTGKLTFPTKLLIEANNILSLFTNSYKDIYGMKERIKKGYDAEYSEHIKGYDQLGYQFQERAAKIQLSEIDLKGKTVLDVGCGTGALAKIALEQNAKNVTCGDISIQMLKQAKQKKDFIIKNFFLCKLDAEKLPYKNNSFDAVISGMSFGLFINQKLAVQEMIRVTKPFGLISIGAHGPEHYWEAIDATFRSIKKRFVLGYRIEWWPRKELFIKQLLENENLKNVKSKRIIWHNEFKSGSAAYDFFAAISSSWWYAKFPSKERIKDSIRTRNYFDLKKINVITDDIIIASGHKTYEK